MADEKTPDNDETNYRAKITIATIGGNPGIVKSEKKRCAIMQVYGIATGIKQVENVDRPDEPFIAITGNFEAVNMQSGEIFRSGVCYLPSGLHEMVVGMLDELKQGDHSKFDKQSVQFALAVDAEPAGNKSGYTYVAKSLLPPAKADPLADLRMRAHKLLPPPTRALAD